MPTPPPNPPSNPAPRPVPPPKPAPAAAQKPAPRPAVPKPKMKEVFFCACGAKFNVSGIKTGARIQCSRCRKVSPLTAENVKLEKVQAEFVNTKKHQKPAPPPPQAAPPPDASQPPEEEEVPAGHLIFSVRESLRTLVTLIALLLLAGVFVPWHVKGESKMAWQVMSDDTFTPGFADKFLVGYGLIAGLSTLMVSWMAKAHVRGLVVLAAAAPAWLVPWFKDARLLDPITGGPGWVRCAVHAAFACALAVAYVRVFFHWSWTARALMFLLGPAIVVLYFLPSDLGQAGAERTSLLAHLMDGAKKDALAYVQVLPLVIGLFTFFATFLGKGGKWFGALIVTAGFAFYLFEPARRVWEQYHTGDRAIGVLVDSARRGFTLGACALLTFLGLGDWIACALLRLHILKLQEKRG